MLDFRILEREALTYLAWHLQLYAKMYRKTNIFYPLIRTRKCVHQGVNVSFSEYVLR